MRFSTYKLQTFLRLKRDLKLCSTWEFENLGYWGDAPDWAEAALGRVSDTIKEWEGYFDFDDVRDSQGFLPIQAFDPYAADEGVGDMYTFCKLAVDD